MDEEEKVHYGDHVVMRMNRFIIDILSIIRKAGFMMEDKYMMYGDESHLILCGIVVNLCSFSSKPRRPKRLASPFCQIRHDKSLFFCNQA